MADAHASLPSAATISSKLRDVVVAIYQSGNTDDLTVKRVRARAEAELGLDAGFFKTDARWKEKSKDEIAQCVVCVPGWAPLRELTLRPGPILPRRPYAPTYA